MSMAEDAERREEELLALGSIYDDGKVFVVLPEPNAARIQATPQRHTPLQLVTKGGRSGRPLTVEYLPPITVNVHFPSTYPSSSPPHASISCPWLNNDQIHALTQKLQALWKDGDGEIVLFVWISFLQDDAWDFLGFSETLDLNEATQDMRRKRKEEEDEEGGISSSSSEEELTKRKEEEEEEGIEEKLTKLDKDEVNNSAQDNGTTKDQHAEPEEEEVVNRLEEDDSARKKESKITGADMDLGEGATAAAFDPRKNYDNEHQEAELLAKRLREFNQKEKLTVFQTSVHQCQVCFDDKHGSLCLMFEACDHVFCKECIGGYFHVKIQDGEVNNLLCPAPKCGTQAHPAQVQQVVSADDFSRYDSLLLRRYLARQGDVAYCPRSECQRAVVVHTGTRLGFCANCTFMFCTLCLKGSHGMAYCALSEADSEGVQMQYMMADKQEKERLLTMYGAKQLKRKIKRTNKTMDGKTLDPKKYEENLLEVYYQSSSETKQFIHDLFDEDTMHIFLTQGKLDPNKEECDRIMEFCRLGSKSDRRKLAKFVNIRAFQAYSSKTLDDRWIKGNAKPCPKCSVAIEKNGGCNHMYCEMCHTHFLWECLHLLDACTCNR